MNDFIGVLGGAVGAFAGTNIDDIIVLAVLFTASRTTGRPRTWQIWAGQYAGVGTLVAASVLAALGLAVVPDKWVGALGLIPLTLGVRGLARTLRTRDSDDAHGAPAIATSVGAVAAVTIANGADNIAIYTPILRTMSAADATATIAIFAVMVAVWCLIGKLLGSHRHVTTVIERWGHWIVPTVFIGIGVFIIYESHLMGNLADLL